MKTPEMTSKERVVAAISHNEFDKYPAITPTSVANIESMTAANSYFPEAHLNSQSMADLASLSHTLLGFDSVMPYFSVHLEAQALGCEVNWNDSARMPVITKKAIQNIQDFTMPGNFLDKTECKKLIKAIKILKKRFGDNVVIIGKVIGPWSLAYNLYGVEKLILDTILEPKKIHDFINELVNVPIKFAKAQFEAGADIVTWADHVTSDLISAKLYEEFMLPVHKYAANKLHGYGHIILHTCGNVMDRLELIKMTGFKMFHIDSRNDIRKAIEIAGKSIILTGSINNPITLASGSRIAVKEEVLRNIDAGIKLISPECAVPFNVPNINLAELVNVAHRTKVS